MHYFKKSFANFLRCGLCGWCMEILFTAYANLKRRDLKAIGHTSLWMFPIYGLACFIAPLSKRIRKLHWCIRGSIYTFLIFCVEFFSGRFLTKYHLCPWNYQTSKYHIHGVIRLDFIPVWFATGLFFEQWLTSSRKDKRSIKRHLL